MEKIPFFLLVAPVSMAVYFAQKGGGQFLLRFPLGFRLETALMGYARYLGKMFWPTNYSVLYPYPDHWPVGELLLAAVLILSMSLPPIFCGGSGPICWLAGCGIWECWCR